MKTYEEGLKDGQALALTALTRLSNAYDIMFDIEEVRKDMMLKPSKDLTELMAVVEVAKQLIEHEFWQELNAFPDPDRG